ncbi:MAG: YihY/virulence factor BrkB family protein [Candidatus Aminicenantia bacterium]
MDFSKNFFRVLKESWQKFSNEKSDDLSAIISFYILFATVPSLGLFAFLISKILGSEMELFRSIYIFSKGYFTALDPNFFVKIKYLIKSIEKLGWFGIFFCIPICTVVFTKITNAINIMFGVNLKRSFFKNTLFQLALMFFTGSLIFLSLILSLTFSAIHGYITRNPIITKYINPKAIYLLINFSILQLLPFLLSFVFFFVLYKFIPPVAIKTSSALFSAIFTTSLWEVAKRVFTWYIGNIALWGRLHGTLSAIAGYILLIDLSIYFLLFGASLTSALNTEIRQNET